MQDQEGLSEAPDTTVSDSNQDIHSTQSVSNRDKVAYETHSRLLNQKKKVEAENAELLAKFNEMNEQKLASEGKKDELLDAYKKRIEELQGKVNEFAFSSVSSAVRLTAKDMGCVDDDAIVKHIDLTTLNVGDGFSVDRDEVRTMLESVKKEKPYFFTAKNPNVNNDVPNTNPNTNASGVDFSKMTKEELVAYGKKHGL